MTPNHRALPLRLPFDWRCEGRNCRAPSQASVIIMHPWFAV
jgi:hypothetical protein